MIPFICNVHQRQIQKGDSWVPEAGGTNRGIKRTANGENISFWNDDLLELGWLHNFVNIKNATELYTFERMNFTASKLYLS